MGLNVTIYGYQQVSCNHGSSIKKIEVELFSRHITHNLWKMATAAGIYEALWEPKKIGIDKPRDLISVLEKGLDELKNNPTHYKKFDSKNGWGVYEDFVKFVEKILCACYLYPNEFLNVSI